MNEAIGIVREREGSLLTVDVDAAVCPRCQAGQGCGAGLFSASSRTITIRVEAGVGLDVSPGDGVQLSLGGRDLVRGVLVAYGLPLLGLLLGTAVAVLSGAGETIAIVVALLGLVSGFFASRIAARLDPCLSRLRPVASAPALVPMSGRTESRS